MTMWNDYEKIARRLDRIANAFERIANALETANIIEADRKTEPSGYKMKPVEQTEPQTDCVKVGKWYSFTDYIVEMQGDRKPKEFRIVPQTEVRYSDSTDYQGAVDYVTDTDCSWK